MSESSSAKEAGSTKKAARSVFQRIFSFPMMLACFLAALSLLTVSSRLDDPDMWWHLKTGEVIWTTHHIPTTDLFSYTTNHHGVVPQEWVSQALIYGAYRLGGYTGLMVWLWVFSTALLIVGYALCSLYSGNAKIGFLGAMVLWFFSTVGLAVRPQLIGYTLLVLELLLVYLGRTRSSRWLWGLPVLFALWVNCHGSFFLGLGVLGILLACSFCEFQAGSIESKAWEPYQRRTLGIAFLCSIAAVFLNPGGLGQVTYPLNTFLKQSIVTTQIEEWKPLLLSDPRGIGLLFVVCFVLIYALMHRMAVLYLHELVLLAIGMWLAFNHQRLAFAFGVFAAPVVARLLSKSWEGYDPETDRWPPNALCIVLAVVVMYFAFPSRRSLEKQVVKGSPVKAVSYLESHAFTGNMMNSFTDGGYLIWAAPDHPVFVDGRADVFEWTGVLAEAGNWAMLESDPNALLDKYKVKFCLLDRGSAIAEVMPLLRGWKQVYSDDQAVIYVRVDNTQPVS